MKFELRITSPANRDLTQQGKYLAERNAVIARRFLAAVRLSCERLRANPDLGEVWSDGDPRDGIVRCWCVRGFEKYVIYYRVISASIQILRVLHSAQDAEQEVGS